MTTRVRSHRETALLETGNLCLGRQRHHHVHVGRRHDDNSYIDTHEVTPMAYGPRDGWLMALKLPLDLAKGLTNIESAVKALAYGLRVSSAVAGDLTCKDWPFTTRNTSAVFEAH